MSQRFRRSFVCLVCAVLPACQASYPSQPTAARSIALMIHSGALVPVEVGTNAPTFLAYALDSDGAWRAVTSEATWSSSDPGVARVVEHSRLMPLSPGSITITARYDGVTATADMVVIDNTRTVPPSYPRLQLFPNFQSQVGSRAAVSALYQATSNSSRQDVRTAAAWSSDDPRVATVDGNGILQMLAVGRTVIRASYDDASAWFYLSVAPPQ